MGKWRFGGLRTRLLAVVLIGIVPTSVLLYARIADEQAARLADVRTEAQLLVESQARNVAGVLDATRAILLGASQAPAVLRREVARANILCRNVMAKTADYSNIALADSNGRVWASAAPVAGITDISAERWFREARSRRRFALGTQAISRTTGRPVIPCAYPVLDGRGRVADVMVAEVNVDRLRRVLSGALPDGASSTLVDREAVVVARIPTLPGIEGAKLADAELVRTVLRGSRGTSRIRGLDGIVRIYAFAPVVEEKESPLHLTIGFDERGITGAANRAYQQAIVVFLLTAVVALGLAWAVAETSVARPTRQLIETAQRLASGDFSVRSNLPRASDEFGQLGNEFDSMAGAIQQRLTDVQRARDELAQLNRELDRRVADRTAELEASNKELEAFSYSVSHDLRAPLRSVEGFSQAILEDHADQLDADGRDYLARVRASATRMGELIDSLLALSRLSRAPLERGRVDVSALAQAILDELHSEHPERRVVASIQPGLEADADAALLRVAFENLLRNAWKFTAGRAEAHIEVGSAASDDATEFFVADDGVGFEMAHADQLFGAFQRLHANDEFPGLGIGLATAYRVVRRHGGKMWAEGVPGKGATFHLTIPRSLG
jgi:signal transduction histidine kinase